MIVILPLVRELLTNSPVQAWFWAALEDKPTHPANQRVRLFEPHWLHGLGCFPNADPTHTHVLLNPPSKANATPPDTSVTKCAKERFLNSEHGYHLWST